jgi:hypothetical protein
MATKEPHIAQIDAMEKLHHIRMTLQQAMAPIRAKLQAGGKLTPDELAMVKAFRQQVIDATRKVQDEYIAELESHGLTV